MTHTHGPWKAQIGKNGDGFIYYQPSYSALAHDFSNVICEMPENKYRPDIAAANASLICAAPDMYEALKAALPYIQHFLGGWSNHTHGQISTQELFEQIKSAIAKAEGK